MKIPIRRDATIATHSVDSSTAGMLKPEYSNPGKKYGTSLNCGKNEVRAKRAKTFVIHAKSPSVNKLRGKSRTLINGTSKKFIIVKASAPISSDLNPPV